jgi:hypothetical protein
MSVHGVRGRESPDFFPGARAASASWVDNDDNLWLFGGEQYNNRTIELVSDLWRFNLKRKLWSFISGEKETDLQSFHGVMGRGTNKTLPGARMGSTNVIFFIELSILLQINYIYLEEEE